MSRVREYWLEYLIAALAVVALITGIAHQTSRSDSSVGPLQRSAGVRASTLSNRLSGKTVFSVDTVSTGRVLRTYGGMQSFNVAVRRGDAVVITGWAVDQIAQAPASAVRLQIDNGGMIDAQYGGNRPDVARVLGTPALIGSGFTALISTAHVTTGRHGVALLIFDAKGTGFYLERNRIVLNVR